MKGILDGGRNDDRGAVLIVVEHRDLHALLELGLDLEAFRALDVLQVDAAESRFQQLAGADDLAGVFRAQLEIEHIDVSEAFKQNALAFHYGLSGARADVAKSKNSRAVGDDSDQVSLRSVFVYERGVALYLKTRDGHARRVRQAKVALRAARFCRDDRYFSRVR